MLNETGYGNGDHYHAAKKMKINCPLAQPGWLPNGQINRLKKMLEWTSVCAGVDGIEDHEMKRGGLCYLYTAAAAYAKR
jgi:hypothetical protein